MPTKKRTPFQPQSKVCWPDLTWPDPAVFRWGLSLAGRGSGARRGRGWCWLWAGPTRRVWGSDWWGSRAWPPPPAIWRGWLPYTGRWGGTTAPSSASSSGERSVRTGRSPHTVQGVRREPQQQVQDWLLPPPLRGHLQQEGNIPGPPLHSRCRPSHRGLLRHHRCCLPRECAGLRIQQQGNQQGLARFGARCPELSEAVLWRATKIPEKLQTTRPTMLWGHQKETFYWLLKTIIFQLYL